MSEHDRNDHLRKLVELIEDVDIAMLTTVGSDGRLVSRPLATREAEDDGDLWFATGADSGKVEEIRANPHVNVAYASPSKNVYVSVSGTASVVDDREQIERLWSPALKVYFPEGKGDPNLRLIRVSAESAEYWDGPGSAAGKALYLAAVAVTRDAGTMSENERLDLS